MKAIRIIVAAALFLSGAVAIPAAAANWPSSAGDSSAPMGKLKETVELEDTRLKFELNATDQDAGVQVFLDGEPWERIKIFDPNGRLIFRASASGSIGKTGLTEVFMESSEPELSELPLDELLKRFPAGDYHFNGRGIEGERLVGTAVLTHDLPDGPTLVSPIEGDPAQDPADTTVVWEPVAPPNGSPIIGYQVIIENTETGLTALPKVILDVMMPPTATSLDVPPGFLMPDTEYEWEVLAIEQGGNQTLSSSVFTTAS